MIREFKEEIERLRKMLEMQGAGALLGQLGAHLPPPAKSHGGDVEVEEGSPQEEQRRATEPVSAPVGAETKLDALDFASMAFECELLISCHDYWIFIMMMLFMSCVE
jgi:hypothetical protein